MNTKAVVITLDRPITKWDDKKKKLSSQVLVLESDNEESKRERERKMNEYLRALGL